MLFLLEHPKHWLDEHSRPPLSVLVSAQCTRTCTRGLHGLAHSQVKARVCRYEICFHARNWFSCVKSDVVFKIWGISNIVA